MAIRDFLRVSLHANPITFFIYSVLSKWYIIIALASTMVVYWGFKGLYEAGVLQVAETVVVKALTDVKAVAQHCTPKIANLQKFWECVKNTDKYIEHKDEEKLRGIIENSQRLEQTTPYSTNPHNPYHR